MFYTHLSPPCRPGLPSFGRALNNCNLIFAGQPLKLFARLPDLRTIICTPFRLLSCPSAAARGRRPDRQQRRGLTSPTGANDTEAKSFGCLASSGKRTDRAHTGAIASAP